MSLSIDDLVDQCYEGGSENEQRLAEYIYELRETIDCLEAEVTEYKREMR